MSQEKDKNVLRSLEEIAVAHDKLVSIVTGEAPGLRLSESDRRLMAGQADVLCWVLSHGHNQEFAKNMRTLDAALLRAGYKLVPIDKDVEGKDSAPGKDSVSGIDEEGEVIDAAPDFLRIQPSGGNPLMN